MSSQAAKNSCVRSSWANAFLSQLDLTQEFFAAWDDMRVLPEETITLSMVGGLYLLLTLLASAGIRALDQRLPKQGIPLR
ncbi:amino acid ABC transporter permease [Alcaligenes faecalis subsp. faecalis NCIB 8687]|nr:amino acid ABC transporter permease [Alcaligenes faecalis subsp. faecalis NCIB 8687]